MPLQKVEKRSRKPTSRYSPEPSPKRKNNLVSNHYPEEPVYNREIMNRDDRRTKSQPSNHVGISRGRGWPIDLGNGSSQQVVGGAQACPRPPNPSGRATMHTARSMSPLPGFSSEYHQNTPPKPAEIPAVKKTVKQVVKTTTKPVVKAAVDAALKTSDKAPVNSSCAKHAVSKAGIKPRSKPTLSLELFDTSPSQSESSTSDDDAYAQP